MGTRLFIFDAESLLSLLTHYSEGAVPLDARLLGLGVNPLMQRFLGLWVEAKDWPDPLEAGKDYHSPLHLRYMGKRVMRWGKRGDDPMWGEVQQ